MGWSTLRASLRWRWNHWLCRIQGHVPVFARKLFKLKHLHGRVCTRCGDWLQDSGYPKKPKHVRQFKKLVRFSGDLMDWAMGKKP